MKKLSVFDYTDAREFLFKHKETVEMPWKEGYQGVAERLGVTKGYFWLSLHGKRPFARKVIEKFPKALKIPANEAQYLRVLCYMADLDMENKLKREIIDKFRPDRYKKKTK
jgi:hypothetical protein